MTDSGAKPFRFSTGYGGARTRRELVEWARRVEDLGYSTLTISDHFDDQWGPIATLAAVATATERLRVAPLVFCNDYRHPVVLAREAATLDLVADGRLELGLGAGWMTADYTAAGLTFDPPRRRIERLEESLDIIESLWSGTGQRRPPWIIGGGGRAMLRLAARRADIVGLNPRLHTGRFDATTGSSSTARSTDHKLSWIREAAATRFSQLEIQTRVHHAVITDDRRPARAAVADRLDITIEEVAETPHALIGTADQIIDDIRQRRDRWEISYLGVNADVAEALAPVVAALTGA